MQFDQQIKFFSQTVLMDADEKKYKLAALIEAELQKAKDDAENEAKRAAEAMILSEKNRITQINNRTITLASAESKKELSELRMRLTDEIFAEVEEQLRGYAKTAVYRQTLIHSINTALGEYKNAHVVIMSEDHQDIASHIAGDIVFNLADEDFIGGFKLFLPDRNALVDFTYSGRLRDERNDFSLHALTQENSEKGMEVI